MTLIIDRVETEIQMAGNADAPASASGMAAFPTSLNLREQLEMARVLRPVVLEILREHLRELAANGAVR
jgi:hypothetical protein